MSLTLLLLGPIPDFVPPTLDAAISLTRLLSVLPDQSRAEVAAYAAAVDNHLQITVLGPSMPISPSGGGADAEYLRKRLRPGIEVESAANLFDRSGQFIVKLADGTRVEAAIAEGSRGPAPPVSGIALASLAFFAINIAILSLWASRALTAPLARFARAAEEFSLNEKGALLPQSGPDEIRILATALNRLGGRIHAMVEDRTRMIAAVGHDLRTPITRLRLKAEFIEDEATREPILRDLEQMNAMVYGALSYLRDGTAEQSAPTDLTTLLQTIRDQFADMGHNVSYVGPDRLVASVRADDLQRAVTNLVENAVKHGTQTTVRLEHGDGCVIICVVDNGPGIATENREPLLKPFARGDDARSPDGQTGFGLGLSIAEAVARSHRGALTLLDNERGGLVAKITIPASGQQPA